jgi:glycosyltransferase involved in cell wall biosynthesis
MLPDVDQFVYLNQADADIAIEVYGVERQRTHVIQHGCSTDEISRLQKGVFNAATYLVSVGSIVSRKNTVSLARAALRARVPLVFLGKPFNDDDSYFKEFNDLVDGESVIYPGYVSEDEKIACMVGASGFVLASRAESGCIAVYEAAAAGLPMLLSDRPWARAYGSNPLLELVEPDEDALAERLKPFFDGSQRVAGFTFPVATWDEIAKMYLSVYRLAVL